MTCVRTSSFLRSYQKSGSWINRPWSLPQRVCSSIQIVEVQAAGTHEDPVTGEMVSNKALDGSSSPVPGTEKPSVTFAPGDTLASSYANSNHAPTPISRWRAHRAPLPATHIHPGLCEQFVGFMFGEEFCNAYTRLNNPFEQPLRYEEQVMQKDQGDNEAQALINETFIDALEHRLAPPGVWGLGIDRLLMFSTASTKLGAALPCYEATGSHSRQQPLAALPLVLRVKPKELSQDEGRRAPRATMKEAPCIVHSPAGPPPPSPVDNSGSTTQEAGLASHLVLSSLLDLVTTMESMQMGAMVLTLANVPVLASRWNVRSRFVNPTSNHDAAHHLCSQARPSVQGARYADRV
ncbi:hypothetical protein BKA70DRAFT_1225822 [Coprinopsis sp. MPI-PUGE-AT-0042]|nr:hypothetical protein BKA70DRAFT_1225822 [Coprinopsis sp. MPI-PUGE-AT-0042]